MNKGLLGLMALAASTSFGDYREDAWLKDYKRKTNKSISKKNKKRKISKQSRKRNRK